MSVSFYAHAVIGSALAGEALYRVVDRRACAHPLPDGAMFCPTCGKPAYRSEREALFDERNNTLGGLHVVFDGDNEHAVVGPLWAQADADDGPERTPIPDDLRALREQTRAVLEPLGLWDEQQFGLWAMPCVSY